MFRTFLISMFAILLFTLGATASWFYVNMMEDREATDAEMVEGAALPTLPSISPADPIPPLAEAKEEIVIPAAARPGGLGPEDIYRFKTATEATREQMRQQEERLREQRLRIQATNADTQMAQREVEGALEQVRTLLNATEEVLAETKKQLEELKRERAQVKQKKDALDQQQTAAGKDVATKMKTFAELLSSMPPESVADTIKEMVDTGRMDFAIQLLQEMEPRNASKILAEVGDAQLLAAIASRYPVAPVTTR